MFINKLDTIAGWRNMGFRHSWDLYGKLSFYLTNTMKLDFSARNLETIFRTANLANNPYQFYEAGRNIDTQSSDRQALIFNHQLSKNTFYDIRASRFFQHMFIGVTDDGTINGRYLDPDEYEGPKRSDDYDTNPFWWEFYVGGHDRYYHRNFAETYEGLFNILSQVTKHHQLKAGAVYRRHTIMIDEIQLPWLDNPYIEKYTRYPEEAALYLQDLIEYDYMTIHLGMRVEMLNANDTYWEDLYADYGQKVEKPTDWEVNYSPRISFSHVITENATFTFGYGRFTQTPTYRNKYINPEKDVRTWSPLVGNAALSLEKMTAYEFGLNVGLGEGLIVQLIGWSKEYSDLTSTERIQQFPYSYTATLNTDYATSRGFDFVIRKMAPTYSFILEYTYSRATANRKDPWEGYRNTDTPRTMPKRELLMGYDRTHDIGVTFIKRYAQQTGPEIFGIYPLERSVFSMMFLGTSGIPYTPIVGDVPGETNSERGPWALTTNIRYRKSFDIFGQSLILGIRIQNIFDWKIPIDIYPRTGKADDPGARATELIEKGITSTTFWDEPYRYGRRRQIDLSLEYAF